MGKEWLFWVGGGGGSAGRRGRMAEGMEEEEEEEAAAASAGCMCAVFQLFDSNNFQFPLTTHHSEFKPDHSFLQEEASISKGVEAPRNSLELEEPAAAMKAASMSLSLAMKQEEENLNFPVAIKIKTAKSRIPSSALKSRTDIDVSSECSSYSPGTKTPNLVARLMGLDLLPECTSPSNPKLKTKSHFHENLRKTETVLRFRSNRTFFDDDSSTGTARSLPETPRTSSSRRSDSDIHRLSLRLNKENASDEFGNSAERGSTRKGSRFKVLDENATSPGNYAKQIVKQVKENVSRRAGVDITNRNISEPIRKDENIVLLKPNKRNPTIFSRFGDDLTPSYSPKLRFLETTKNKPLAEANTKSLRNSTSSDYSPSALGISNSLPPKIQTFQELQQKGCKKVASRGRCKSSSPKKCLPPQGSDHGIKNKREEPFVRSPAKSTARLTDKKCKKTPFSSDVFYISAPILLPVKTDPSPPVTKLPQKQVSDALASKRRARLSSTPSHSYKLQLHTDKIFGVLENVDPDSTNGRATALSAAAEHENYIQKILRRTRKKWHSCSHPLDPTIFHYLELFHPNTGTISAADLSRRSNRKLIFQLVDELLGEILRPRLGFMKLASPINDHSYLVYELCKKIGGFPAAKCEVLEDIDGLIERDLCNLPLQRSFEEEGDNIVCQIAGEITEWLVRETVAEVGSGTMEESRQIVADLMWRLPSGEMPSFGFIEPPISGKPFLGYSEKGVELVRPTRGDLFH
ncbi:uncharacterized protein [Primulina huaijiensis]|uniref:uncharacterized protein isoform X2 n=1 Tax=Primulina huaijiensis TaxID=1492673 RepID=UPI003CC6FC78